MLCVENSLGSEVFTAPEMSAGRGAADGPLKTGTVWMLPGGPTPTSQRCVRVNLTVYANDFDRYAVISQDKIYCRAWGYISLKHRMAKQTGETSFQLLNRQSDGGAPLAFTVKTPQELHQWMDVLTISKPEQSLEFPKRNVSSVRRVGRSHSVPLVSTPVRRQRLSLPSLREENGISEESEEE